mgnify:CR=1 FL=1
MGETPPVFGIHEQEQSTDIKTEDKSTHVRYNPEDPTDVVLQGDVLQHRGPTIR